MGQTDDMMVDKLVPVNSTEECEGLVFLKQRYSWEDKCYTVLGRQYPPCQIVQCPHDRRYVGDYGHVEGIHWFNHRSIIRSCQHWPVTWNGKIIAIFLTDVHNHVSNVSPSIYRKPSLKCFLHSSLLFLVHPNVTRASTTCTPCFDIKTCW